MVLADLGRTVDGVTVALEDMDLMAMAPLAVLGAGGAFVAQEAVDLVFPQLGFDTDPSSPSGLGLAAAFKMFLAVVLVAVGSRVGGRAFMAISTTLAIGVLIHSGLDIFDMIQRGGLPGASPSRSRSSASGSASSTSASATVQTAPNRRATPSNATSTGGSASSPRSRRKELQNWG